MKQKSALVLSGGGALGMAHVGALRVLENHYEFKYYAGVSAGAIVAAAHAIGKTADEISEIIHSQNFFSLAFDFSNSNFGILRGEKIQKLLDSVFLDTRFEDLEKKGKILRIYATDFTTGERIEFSSGSVSQAVMASLSVPILFQPLFYNDVWLVDGGLTGNFPIDETVQGYTGEKIVGIDVATFLNTNIDFTAKKNFGKIAGAQKMLERTFRILFKSQNNFDINNPRLQIFTPDVSAFTSTDVGKLKDIELCGENYVKNI